MHPIAKSLLDPSWYDDLTHTDDGVFAVAGGVLGYFDEGQVKTFFSALADNFPGAEMVFSAYSRREVSLINRSLQRLRMAHAAMKWALEDANDLTRWDDRITVVDQFSFFRDIPIPHDSAWGEEMIRRMHAIDEQKLMSIVHDDSVGDRGGGGHPAFSHAAPLQLAVRCAAPRHRAVIAGMLCVIAEHRGLARS